MLEAGINIIFVNAKTYIETNELKSHTFLEPKCITIGIIEGGP
jgi:hypothetical protein